MLTYGFNGESLGTYSDAFRLNNKHTTYHARFHCTNRLVFSIMRHIGPTVEQVIDSVSTIRSYDCAPSLSCNGFSVEHVRRVDCDE